MSRSRIAKLAAAFAAGVAATALIMTATAQTTLNTEAGKIQVDIVAKLDNPWGMTFLPDGRLLISEKSGKLVFFKDGALSDPLTGIPEVAYQGQGGLLDVEIDPKFAQNQLVYIYYAEAADPQPNNPDTTWDVRLGDAPKEDDSTLKGGAVARGRLDGNELKDVKVIWRQEPKEIGRGHFGGRLVFAPDGKLFITSGDRQRFDPAQDLHANLGKVVRINADGSVPEDNPFKDKGCADIYTMGHRNPLGAAINPVTGDLWLDEMGPKGGDELNLIKAGQNYGWPVVSNGSNYDDSDIPDHDTHPEFAPPVKFWNPVISPSGMMFYTGDLFPKWKGSVLIGGLSSMALVRVPLDGDKATGEERIAMGQRIRDLIQAPDGSVYVITDGDDGELWHLTPGDAS